MQVARFLQILPRGPSPLDAKLVTDLWSPTDWAKRPSEGEVAQASTGHSFAIGASEARSGLLSVLEDDHRRPLFHAPAACFARRSRGGSLKVFLSRKKSRIEMPEDILHSSLPIQNHHLEDNHWARHRYRSSCHLQRFQFGNVEHHNRMESCTFDPLKTSRS